MRHRRQVDAADVLRRVQAPQAQAPWTPRRSRACSAASGPGPARGLPLQHRRPPAASARRRTKRAHQILEHPVLFAEFEIHAGSPGHAAP